jgi:hypothetical protein
MQNRILDTKPMYLLRYLAYQDLTFAQNVQILGPSHAIKPPHPQYSKYVGVTILRLQLFLSTRVLFGICILLRLANLQHFRS